MAATSKPAAPSASDVYLRMFELTEAQANKNAKASDDETPATQQASRSSRINQAALIAFGTISLVTSTATCVYAALTMYDKNHGGDGSESQHNMVVAGAAYLSTVVVSSIYGAVTKQFPKFFAVGSYGPFNLIYGACALAGKCKDA
ncbi:MAG TPA: hypothetical protein VLG44_00655 [Chlamydiales bacterium]|nr:hypothetical protein [Chlamydiales bacterium]